MNIQRLGVMGGTFDPVHFGHLLAAQAVAKEYDLDSVAFVPTGDSYQKTSPTSAQDRFNMTELAIAPFSDFQMSRVDLERPGPTFTIDTLRDLRGIHPDAKLFFITGADSLESINTWKDSANLWSEAHFVGVTRPGHSLKVPESPPGAVTLLEIPGLAVSSSEIRAKVVSGESISDLVPDSVVDYIVEHKLYKS